jgi:hypothetical protein
MVLYPKKLFLPKRNRAIDTNTIPYIFFVLRIHKKPNLHTRAPSEMLANNPDLQENKENMLDPFKITMLLYIFPS